MMVEVEVDEPDMRHVDDDVDVLDNDMIDEVEVIHRDDEEVGHDEHELLLVVFVVDEHDEHDIQATYLELQLYIEPDDEVEVIQHEEQVFDDEHEVLIVRTDVMQQHIEADEVLDDIMQVQVALTVVVIDANECSL